MDVRSAVIKYESFRRLVYKLRGSKKCVLTYIENLYISKNRLLRNTDQNFKDFLIRLICF